jgi:hypothetical protein
LFSWKYRGNHFRSKQKPYEVCLIVWIIIGVYIVVNECKLYSTGNSIRLPSAYAPSTKKAYFEIVKKCTYFSTIYVRSWSFRGKPILFVVYVKKGKICLLKSLIFSTECCLFTHATWQVDFSWNDFVGTWHVKMYVRTFCFHFFGISKYWRCISNKREHMLQEPKHHSQHELVQFGHNS